KKARENMDKAGLKIYSRFDANDALENREDLLQLYDVLSSVKDKNGNHAVFSPMALPCNINFEKMAEESYSEYIYETLPETFSKLEAMQPSAYSGMMELWNDGIRNNLLAPQFHGREHLNLRILRENLAGKDKATLTALKNRSYTSISQPKYTAAFAYRDKEDTKGFSEIIRTGIQHFKEVYSYEPVFFTPPAQQ